MKYQNYKSLIINYFSKYKDFLPKEIISYEQKYLSGHINRLIFSLKLIEEVSRDRKMKILDIGAHGGYLSYLLKHKGHEVYGLDKERVETKFWKKRFDLEGINYKNCDLTKENLPYQDEKFDIILFFETIEHLPVYPDIIIQELKRVLLKGGFILLSTPNFLRLGNRIRIILGKTPYPNIIEFNIERGTGHFREFTAKELIFLIERFGLKVIKVQYYFFDSSYPIIIEFILRLLYKLVKAFNPYIVLIVEK